MIIVHGEGNPAADVWLIGRDPGAEEEQMGRPFVGSSGRLIRQLAKRAGLDLSTVFIDNVLPVRPANNIFGNHKPSDLLSFPAELRERISQHQPQLIIAAGSHAFTTVMGYHSFGTPDLPNIQEARGYLFESKLGPRVLPIIHPAAVLREWVPWRPLLEWDLRKAARERSLGFPPLPQRKVTVLEGGARNERLLSKLNNAAIHGQMVAIDIENTADLQLSCLGVAVSPTEAYVLPASNTAGIVMTLHHPVGKVLQNGMYDRFFLEEFAGLRVQNVVFDTMLAWHTLMPELAGLRDDANRVRRMRRKTHKGLRFLASVYTRDGFWKDYDFDNDYDRYRLNGLDCCITLDIATQQQAQLAAAQTPAGQDQAGRLH